MVAFYTDHFVLPLPPGHRFPMLKYARIRERCLSEGILRPEELHEPPAAPLEELALVYTTEYLTRVETGALSPLDQRRIGFPWSPEMVERSRRSTGATIAAARAALAAIGEQRWGIGINRKEDGGGARWGVAVNLAGGTHHAYPGHGEGFCVFNDAAVAVRVLQREGRITRVAILDCDVHQGNGTAAIFAGDPSVFTFSVHGARNYPFRKERSTLDVELPDRAGDEAFLAALEMHIPHILADFQPELVIYLAGADPYAGDRFGRLAMTKGGLATRDSFVLACCRAAGIPIAITTAGGYACDTEDTVDIHVMTIRTAAHLSRLGASVEAGKQVDSTTAVSR